MSKALQDNGIGRQLIRSWYFSILAILLLTGLTSLPSAAQSIGRDSLIPRTATGAIDFAEVYGLMVNWSRAANAAAEVIAERCASTVEFVSLIKQEKGNNRDSERFLVEAERSYNSVLESEQTFQAYLDSMVTMFSAAAAESLAQTGTYPDKPRAKKARIIFHEMKANAEEIVITTEEVRDLLVKNQLWRALPLQELVAAGDTGTIKTVFTDILAERSVLPESLEPVVVRALADGAMEISTAFFQAQRAFDLESGALDDVDNLVTQLVRCLVLLGRKGVDVHAIHMAAYLRDTEEDLSFIPDAATYNNEFSQDSLMLTYRFINPQDNPLPEWRTLKIQQGTVGFIAATALKLEGIRRGFLNVAIDTPLAAELEINAPVEQIGPERYEIRLVIK